MVKNALRIQKISTLEAALYLRRHGVSLKAALAVLAGASCEGGVVGVAPSKRAGRVPCRYGGAPHAS